MKKVKRWRYYCDYCKKSGASGGHMARHEKSCTMNPNRTCLMCQYGNNDQAEMPDLLEALKIANEKLREVSGNCPICILSALRQSGYPGIFQDFNFEKEKEMFWDEINRDRHESRYNY